MSSLPLDATLTTTLVRLARQYRLGVDQALSGLGLSDALALPLVLLGRRPEGLRQNAVADELGVEGPTLVRLLDRLVEDGLVERREDPDDRRAKIVQLTPAGQHHSRRATQALDAYRGELLAGVPSDDIAACVRVFNLLEARLATTRREARS